MHEKGKKREERGNKLNRRRPPQLSTLLSPPPLPPYPTPVFVQLSFEEGVEEEEEEEKEEEEAGLPVAANFRPIFPRSVKAL